MPFIEFFRCNVRHADVLVILFSFFPLDNPIFSIHLSTFRDYSFRIFPSTALSVILIRTPSVRIRISALSGNLLF